MKRDVATAITPPPRCHCNRHTPTRTKIYIYSNNKPNTVFARFHLRTDVKIQAYNEFHFQIYHDNNFKVMKCLVVVAVVVYFFYVRLALIFSFFLRCYTSVCVSIFFFCYSCPFVSIVVTTHLP